ncbi:hypothetical protein AB0M46_41950 [Dactylosporangium sp. NPDC051485]|uniref:hypothetical protein n=1 Tax=Dactylosporangium sp. NPDC051485 TaxID=3154846 RepID=UPI00343C4354
MSVDGNWDLEIDSPRGKQHVQLAVTAEGGRLTGTMSNSQADISTDLLDGTIDGDELAWKVKMKMFPVTLSFQMTLDEDTMEGKVKAGMFGKFDASGQRQ